MLVPRSRKALLRWLKANEIEAFVAFKVSLAVAIGTLLSLTKGYSALFNDPFALSSQVIFTILGGANVRCQPETRI